MTSILGAAAPTAIDPNLDSLFAQPQKRKLSVLDTREPKTKKAKLISGDSLPVDTSKKAVPAVKEKKGVWARRKERRRLETAAVTQVGEEAGGEEQADAVGSPEKRSPKVRTLSTGQNGGKNDVATGGNSETVDDKHDKNNSVAEKDDEDETLNDTEKLSRTVFLGNVVAEVVTKKSTKKAFQKLLEQSGQIESIRFRSIAFSAPLARRTAFAAKLVHPDRDTCHAYAVFSTPESAAKCVTELNGTVWMEKHLRVDMAGRDGPPDTKRSVFLGNLPLDCKDESLWELFKDMESEIEGVRVVRDAKTNLGRGVGYVTFKSRATATLALKHTGSITGREIRVARCKPPRDSAMTSGSKTTNLPLGAVAKPGAHRSARSARPAGVDGAVRRLVKMKKIAKPLSAGEAMEGERAKRGDRVSVGGVKAKARKRAGGPAGKVMDSRKSKKQSSKASKKK
ncbi:Nucleolar protein 12 [Gonapodya sp. JEL0774]|nr:Nucleolar protein 12 [Gonapodya sp. JEL0774]